MKSSSKNLSKAKNTRNRYRLIRPYVINLTIQLQNKRELAMSNYLYNTHVMSSTNKNSLSLMRVYAYMYICTCIVV